MNTFSRRALSFLDVVAERIVPEIAGLDAQTRAEVVGTVDRALAERPRSLRFQFRAFLFVLRWLPALRYGAPLDRLTPARQDRVLRAFQDSPVPRLRSGLWGIKTLIFMGYYGRPEVWPRIGYAPVPEGNEKLGA